ncbi:MAG TPA: hypothetical protein GX716_10885 [Firmicutes bacterium]|jgi:hypothetical protein|nr:hypothetical protein [Candidatus Fermentithermobacillaceae bacterium]
MPMLIDGIQIKTPQLNVGTFLITKSERTADGTMTMDIIAEKRRLDLDWPIIRDTDLQQILSLLKSKTFHTVTYPDPEHGEDRTITVYRGDVTTQAGHRVAGTRYWTDVSIALIEQ